MSNIAFYEEISKIIPKLSSNMHLISSTAIYIRARAMLSRGAGQTPQICRPNCTFVIQIC